MVWFSLITWCSASLVLMILPQGLKIQGALAVNALLFAVLLIVKRHFYVINKLLIVLLATCFVPLYLSVLWSHDQSRTSYELLKISPGIFGFLVLSQVLRNPEDLKKVTTILQVVSAVITVFFAGVLIAQFGSMRGFYRGVEELRGIAGITGSYGQCFVPVGIALILTSRQWWKKVLFFVLTECCILVVFYSSTRAAVLSLACSLVIMFFGLVAIRKFTFRYCCVIMLFIPLTTFFVYKPPTEVLTQEVQHRIVKTVDDAERNVNTVLESSTRMMTWGRAVAVFTDHPLFGIGYEAFSRKYWFTNPHNILLDFLLGGGVVGLITFLVFVVCTVYGFIRGGILLRFPDPYLNLNVIALGATFIGVLVYGLFWQLLWHPFFYVLSAVGLFAGIMPWRSVDSRRSDRL